MFSVAACELLHETKDHADWTVWTNIFKPTGVDPATGQDFPNIDIATKAAVMSIGVVMADLILCREELETGTLVAPFPKMVCQPPSGGVCLLGGRETWKTPKVEAFKAWAYEIASQDRDSVGHLLDNNPME